MAVRRNYIFIIAQKGNKYCHTNLCAYYSRPHYRKDDLNVLANERQSYYFHNWRTTAPVRSYFLLSLIDYFAIHKYNKKSQIYCKIAWLTLIELVFLLIKDPFTKHSFRMPVLLFYFCFYKNIQILKVSFEIFLNTGESSCYKSVSFLFSMIFFV